MSLPPVAFHYFTRPLPYQRAWALQQKIHEYQLRARVQQQQHQDVLLLLQHRPTYTAGRRQTDESTDPERTRLTRIGADFVTATRGGQLTYHGPGQIVGYPLLDLARYTPTMGARDYVCRIQKLLQQYLAHHHSIPHAPSEHTGVFLDPHTKIASIGVQIRHRLTSHGFAINITKEPLAWFDQIIACGLQDVSAGSIESKLERPINLDSEIPNIIHQFGQMFERETVPLDVRTSPLGDLLLGLERDAEGAGSWLEAPKLHK